MSKSGAMETLDVDGAPGWHSWLQKRHLISPGVWLVFHKGARGPHSITYDEALDEALAFGWIDSIIRKVDDEKYVRKFTPRRPDSIWSQLNIGRVARLKREGRMTEWGLEAFSKRTSEVSLLESYNSGRIGVSAEFEAALRKNKKAWANYQGMGPSHRKRYAIWIAGAKKPATKKRRIEEAVRLVEDGVRNLLK